MDNDVTLTIENLKFSGWESVSIKRSIEAAAGSFSLSLSERWNDSVAAWPVFVFDKAEVRIGSDVLITGYIDEVNVSLSADSHSITVNGRDKTADIVDCSALHKSGQWNNRSLLKIASDLCTPFGITVKGDTTAEAPIESVVVQPGETIFDLLSRLAKGRKLLITSSPDATLVFGRSAPKAAGNTALKEGENILSCEAEFTGKERFSSYTVEGQPDMVTGLVFSKGSAMDENVPKHRPLLIIAEEKASISYCKARAGWEAKVRAAKSKTVRITVQGFRDLFGKIWEVNTFVRVEAPSIRVSGDLLITETEFVKDNGGSITRLTLKRADAYLPDVTMNSIGKEFELVKSKKVRKVVEAK